MGTVPDRPANSGDPAEETSGHFEFGDCISCEVCLYAEVTQDGAGETNYRAQHYCEGCNKSLCDDCAETAERFDVEGRSHWWCWHCVLRQRVECALEDVRSHATHEMLYIAAGRLRGIARTVSRAIPYRDVVDLSNPLAMGLSVEEVRVDLEAHGDAIPGPLRIWKLAEAEGQ